MKNTFGQAVTLTIFGESHGPAVGVVLDGLAPGLPVDEECIRRQLARRRPATALDTPRQEPDHYQILSGVFQGRTTGTPVAIIIPNENVRSGDYAYGLARPSHADYAAYCKYHGYEDWRGGGHFSGRVTAPLAAAGAILLSRTAECPEKRLDETVAMLRGLNEHARIVTTPWKDLTGEQYRLYRLVWSRFLASQMANAVYDSVAVEVEAAGHSFRASSSSLRRKRRRNPPCPPCGRANL